MSQKKSRTPHQAGSDSTSLPNYTYLVIFSQSKRSRRKFYTERPDLDELAEYARDLGFTSFELCKWSIPQGWEQLEYVRVQ